MKIKHGDLKKAAEVVKKLNFEMLDGYLFFPVEFEFKHVDEFGIESKSYKAETFYGNKLIPGLLLRGTECVLAYVQSTSVFAFSLAEYLAVTPQPNATTEDFDFILKYESGLVKTGEVSFSSMITIDGEYSRYSMLHPQILNEEKPKGGITLL